MTIGTIDEPPPPGFTLVYDDACAFCRSAVALVLLCDRRRRLRTAPYRAVADVVDPGRDGRRPASWFAIRDDGVVVAGGAVFAPLLGRLPGGRRLGRLSARFPRASERAYRLVAARRRALSRFVPRAAVARADRIIAARERASRPAT